MNNHEIEIFKGEIHFRDDRKLANVWIENEYMGRAEVIKQHSLDYYTDIYGINIQQDGYFFCRKWVPNELWIYYENDELNIRWLCLVEE